MGSESADWKEKRRLQALKLKQKGWKQTDIAEALGVTDGAVSQWMSRSRQEGKEALLRSADAGPDKRLSDEDRQKLPALLKKGPSFSSMRPVFTCCPASSKRSLRKGKRPL